MSLDRYAVMGNPIAHSKSPFIHGRFAAQTGEALRYEALLVELGGFPAAVAAFVAGGGKGLNVTVPFKQEAWALAARRSRRAERAGAVNTLKVEADGSLSGDNTDGVGLVRDLQENERITQAGRRLLVLGAGGAVRGVLEPLLAAGPAQVTVANRTAAKAVELADLFGDEGAIDGRGLDALAGRQYDIVVNGTAASIKGELPELPSGLLAAGAFCYDMMYGKEPTPFMRWARGEGGTAVDGLGMLVEQAAESFFIWRAVRPQTAPVLAELRRLLAAG